MINLNPIGSTAASEVRVNPIVGTAKVTFANGYGPYRFTRLSRRALAKAALTELIGGQKSVGEWVNGQCWR
jgi:urocanate hydratase